MEVIVWIWSKGPIAKPPGKDVVNGMNPANFNMFQRASRILSLEAMIKQNDELMRCLVETQSGLKTRLHQVEISKKISKKSEVPGGHASAAAKARPGQRRD